MDLDPVNRKNSSNATNLQQQQSNKPTRDDSLVAPAPASQPKLKTQAFKKKTKQVFIASDQLARMLKREEYQSWLLEDSSTGGEKWIGRFESAGAGSGPGTSMGGSSGSTIRASSAATTGSSKVPTYEASNYVVFCLDKNGENFTILPCHRSNKFTHCPNYDTLGPEEAEAAYEKMQKPTTKEDVGRWFMQRRGAAAGSNSMNPINQLTGNSSSIGISTSDFKQKQSLKPSIFDESKISLGSASRPQVKAVSVFGGCKGKFTAVHGGGNLMGEDEDEDVKPKLGQDGDFDEVDYDEEFANDEEGAGNLNDEAMEEDELWELEERMKREMLAAGRAGDEEKDRDNMIVDKDDLFGKRDDLKKEGKAVKKLLMRKADNNDVYDSDDDLLIILMSSREGDIGLGLDHEGVPEQANQKLFDDLINQEYKGIIEAKDPRRRAVDTGCFEEIKKSLERIENKERVKEAKGFWSQLLNVQLHPTQAKYEEERDGYQPISRSSRFNKK
ncbi:hypothetical protein PPACK8108_LOCUS17181 [Phakopsora pachyrhizi]|uniref:Transcription initiation factor IIF subunit alpha n=1 Tax=Phakopsora pachyrhizi TaxID=170000 RepID=A0AAV0BB77_PHAPC|nr:hypothetical protein PPACK8108_LOCUS17181 [Phakopsora pachyrhizi]